MKCFTCSTEMQNVNDVVMSSVRIDWKQCPKCGSEAQINYHPRELFIESVYWKRDGTK